MIKQVYIEDKPQTILGRDYRIRTVCPGHYELSMSAVSESDEHGKKIGFDNIPDFKVTNRLLYELGVIKEYDPYKIIEEFNKTV